MKPEPIRLTLLDVRIGVAVLLCCLSATALKYFGITFSFGEMRLEILQKMTACISCLLVCQDNVKLSGKAGVNRLIITAIGGAVGVVATILDVRLQNEWLMVLFVALGVIITLFLCKCAKVPYINARIGGVTFILVSCTLTQYARVYYAVFRFISTLYGTLVVLLVTWFFDRFLENFKSTS